MSVAVYIENIASFDSHSMDFDMQAYAKLTWLDERLVHTNKYAMHMSA